MMGGGLCWLDYNNDGWLDLFVVNSYGEGDIGAYSAHGGLPRTALFRNDHGRFVNVTARNTCGRAVQRRRLRRRRLQRRRLHGSLRHDGAGRRAALEQRQRHVHRRRALARHRLLRLALRRRRHRRERRRPSRHVRRRLHGAERRRYPARSPASRRIISAFATSSSSTRERPGRPARFREVGRQAGIEPAAVRPLRSVRLHRRERRPPAGSLRRERRGPEPALRERAGWPARVPLRRGG